MANVKDNVVARETRRKLINAAGHVFAKYGLYGATLRQITDCAGVNKAAIHYHFRGKSDLYRAVVRYCLTFSDDEPTDEQMSRCPEDRLRALITQIIRRIFDARTPPWRAIIISHELTHPTAAFNAVMEELIEPEVQGLRKAVRDLLGSRAPQEKVDRITLGIMGQCVIYLEDRRMLARLYPALIQDNHKVEELSREISEFSLRVLGIPPRRQSPRQGRGRRQKGRRTESHTRKR